MKKTALFGGMALMVLLGAGCAASSTHPTLLTGTEMLGKRESNKGMIPSPSGKRALLLLGSYNSVGQQDSGVVQYVILEWTGSSWKEVDREGIQGDTNHLYFTNFSWIDEETITYDRVTLDEGGYHVDDYNKVIGKKPVTL